MSGVIVGYMWSNERFSTLGAFELCRKSINASLSECLREPVFVNRVRERLKVMGIGKQKVFMNRRGAGALRVQTQQIMQVVGSGAGQYVENVDGTWAFWSRQTSRPFNISCSLSTSYRVNSTSGYIPHAADSIARDEDTRGAELPNLPNAITGAITDANTDRKRHRPDGDPR